MTTEQALWIGLVAFAALSVFVTVMWLRTDNQRRNLETTVIAQAKGMDDLTDECAQSTVRLRNARNLIPDTLRYQISVTDWGPDFTGEDGTLPRWRWVVRNADAALKAAVNGTYELDPDTGQMVPPEADDVLMLGNAREMDDAVFAAFAWIEQQETPVHLVWPGAGALAPPDPVPPLASDKIGYSVPQGHTVNVNTGSVQPYRPPVDPPPPPYQPVGGAE